MGRAIQLGVILGAVGCAASYRLPLTPTQVAQAGEPGALVRYLGQRDADPAVCDAAIAGPHVTADARAGRALLGALQSGAVEPAIWQACVDRILANAGSDAQAALLDAMLHTYRALVGHPSLERDPMTQARLAALTAVYGERSPDIRVPAAAAAALAAELRKTARTLGPIGKRSAEQMIATLDVEHGVWGTRVIDPAFLDELATPDYEPFLGFLSQRLPDPALRSEAKRRVIRLHIASSAFYEVQEDAGHVEAMMMELGKNPIAPRLQAPTAAHFDASQLAIDHVIVSQDVRAQTASLAGAPPAGTGGPTVPSFALRGALALDVTGVSQPITLCGAASELDVAPCLLPGDLAIDSPYVRLDSDGTLQLASALTAAQVVELARGRHELAVPLTIAHQSLTDLRWPIAFAIPDPFIAAGERFGAPGPALNVIVEQRDDVLIYAIDTGHAIHWAVVPVAAAAQFAIVSRGGHGAPGRQGKDGADG
ncbi:MAG TPA: hypothetical protein VFP84_05540, partial [Kofleriaceae bacterium]|nr:hypothetical protein [Kofleriaceae bacterium]